MVLGVLLKKVRLFGCSPLGRWVNAYFRLSSRKTEIMQIYFWECSMRVWKTRSRRSFCETASWIDQNQGAIYENALCTTESMAESIDRTPAKLSPVKRRHFQMFKKVHHEKWSFATVDVKVTLAWTVKFTVVLWSDWTGGQLSVIGRQRSQLRGIGKGGAQCRLPCDFFP